MRNFLTLAILISLISCIDNNSTEFQIKVETDRVGDAILLQVDPINTLIDTTNIKNGNLSFQKQLEQEEWFKLKFYDGSSIDLLIKPGEKINIKFNKEELNISGSVGSEKLIEIETSLLNLTTFRDSITKQLQQLRGSPGYEQKMYLYRELFFEKLESHKEFLKNFIENNKNSKAALIALFQQYGNSSPVLTIDEDLEDFEKVVENLKTYFPESNHIEILEDQITRLKPLSYGQIAPDFTLPDINNEDIALSDFKGKIVLIDFWASWCGPCRRENPKLVKLYNQYYNLDFEILSVSLDGTQRQKEAKKSWKEAIIKDNLSQWAHVSELNGWQTHVRDLYNFTSIPYTVLINKKGEIVGKNLRGENLERKIKELIND